MLSAPFSTCVVSSASQRELQRGLPLRAPRLPAHPLVAAASRTFAVCCSLPAQSLCPARCIWLCVPGALRSHRLCSNELAAVSPATALDRRFLTLAVVLTDHLTELAHCHCADCQHAQVREIAPEFYNTLPYYTSYIAVIWRYITGTRLFVPI